MRRLVVALQRNRWLRARGSLFVLSATLVCLQGNHVGHAQSGGASVAADADGRAVTRLPDGRELLTGGIDAGRASVNTWIRDRRTGAVMPGPSLAQPRAWHSSTILPDGRVLVVGGVNESGGNVTTVERIDLTARITETLPSIRFAGSAHSATLLDGHQLLLAGGIRDQQVVGDAEILNLDTGQFTPVGAMSIPRAYHAATLLADGRVGVIRFGGRVGYAA